MTAERVLTERELNRALLARQCLLERFDGRLPRALERVGGLQAQYAPSMYVGLWSRMQALDRGELTRALERRQVVQGTLMRVTIHLVARGDYWPFALATRAARRTLWLRSRRGAIEEPAMRAAAEVVGERLASEPTLHRKQLVELVGQARAEGVGLWIDLVRAPPSGTWERRRSDLFASALDWIGPAGPGRRSEPGELTEGQAVEHLVRSYLSGFGPASRDDIASYTGLRKSDLVPALARLRLRAFRSEAGDDLLDVPRGPLPDPDTPAAVRFLPTWDATLLAHARRTAILPAEHRAKIFHVRNPHSLPTFLVDGVVAGTWRHEQGAVALAPFGRLDAATRRELDDEAQRLAAFHA